jgi:hypothetical protein
MLLGLFAGSTILGQSVRRGSGYRPVARDGIFGRLGNEHPPALLFGFEGRKLFSVALRSLTRFGRKRQREHGPALNWNRATRKGIKRPEAGPRMRTRDRKDQEGL